MNMGNLLIKNALSFVKNHHGSLAGKPIKIRMMMIKNDENYSDDEYDDNNDEELQTMTS